MDSLKSNDFRIAPTTQQGGTQTIQQSIYLAHNNPCGVNKLIFQEMGLTKIRYIDLKDFLDAILSSDEMQALFRQIQIAGTEYMNDPYNVLQLGNFIYSLQAWAQAGISNLPVDIFKYDGYRFRFSVFDAGGCAIYDSVFSDLKPIELDGAGNKNFTAFSLVTNPAGFTVWPLYKICNNPMIMSYIDFYAPGTYPYGFEVMFSDFGVNQCLFPETTLATSSLLVDSANTRSFGIPTYGFSAREGSSVIGGPCYNCCHIINIYSTPNDEGQTTLIESIYARLSLENS